MKDHDLRPRAQLGVIQHYRTLRGFMEAENQLKHFKVPQCITVFISCPGDLLDAKQAVAEAVQEVDCLFNRYGWHVRSWRYENNTRPTLAADGQDAIIGQLPDYDIHVGLMCRRFGTPTSQASSGTIHEFLMAQDRFIKTGRPDILFYFCANPGKPITKTEKLQLEKVTNFRKAYPGLFATFHSVEELKALVKHHLIDLLLREPERKYFRKRSWALWLAQRLDSLKRSLVYLDRSSGFVVRSLGKLDTLLDLPSLMSEQEYDTLLAAQYIRALRSNNDDLRAVHREIGESLPTNFDWDAAVMVADLADGDTDLVGEMHEQNGVRYGFLAALLRLSDALDLDQAAIMVSTGPLMPPATNSPIDCWLAYLTRNVRVSRGGLITFFLGIPIDQKALAPTFCRSVALMFEAHWHQLRALLSVNGVVVVRAPMESVPSRDLIAIPGAVLAELDCETKRAEAAIRELQHFGEGQPCLFKLENVLPLPSSAIDQPLRFTFHPDFPHTLHLWRENEADAIEFAENRPGEILLDNKILLPPGTRYRWSLHRDDGDFISKIASGLVWQLAPEDQIRLEAGKLLIKTRDILLLRLGLHNKLLQELWPKLVTGEATLCECACVYEALLVSYDWIYKNMAKSGQVDLIRNLGNWVHQQILKNRGDQP